jgi:hypothetical protein
MPWVGVGGELETRATAVSSFSEDILRTRYLERHWATVGDKPEVSMEQSSLFEP